MACPNIYCGWTQVTQLLWQNHGLQDCVHDYTIYFRSIFSTLTSLECSGAILDSCCIMFGLIKLLKAIITESICDPTWVLVISALWCTIHDYLSSIPHCSYLSWEDEHSDRRYYKRINTTNIRHLVLKNYET